MSESRVNLLFGKKPRWKKLMPIQFSVNFIPVKKSVSSKSEKASQKLTAFINTKYFDIFAQKYSFNFSIHSHEYLVLVQFC